MITNWVRRPGRLCLLGLLVLVPAGCSPATGRLAGTVTLDGVPLKQGKVHVCNLDEAGNVLKTSTAAIADDGSYQTIDIPVGPVKVLVQGPPLVFPMSKPPPGWKQPVDPVPVRYRQLDTTDLKTDVAGGTQEYSIRLRR